MSDFTLLIPSDKAIGLQCKRPEPSAQAQDHHNLSFLYGMYGQTILIDSRESKSILTIDKEIARAFYFLTPYADGLPMAFDSEKVITIEKKDLFGDCEIQSLKATLLQALIVYWYRYTFVLSQTDDACFSRGIHIRKRLESILRQANSSGDLVIDQIPIATMATSMINLDASSENSETFHLNYSTLLLKQEHHRDDSLFIQRGIDMLKPCESLDYVYTHNAEHYHQLANHLNVKRQTKTALRFMSRRYD